MASPHDVTALLADWSQGNRGALEQLLPLVYAELRRIAARQLGRERVGHTLQPTALVHEAYLRLVDQRQVDWQNQDTLDEMLPGVPEMSGTSINSRRTWLPWAVVAALTAGVLVWEARGPAVPPEDPLANARFTLFTNWDGWEEGAAISPDGRFVAFLSDRDGEFDLWLSQVGTGHFSNLTAEIPPLGRSGVIVRKLGFSGDGTDIWFNPSDAKPLMVMPLTGGTPRVFLPPSSTPAWSPDGARLVYIDKTNREDPMYVADRTGADARQMPMPGVLQKLNPVWSTDGQWIYFVRRPEPQDEIDMDVWRVRSSGGTPERLTEQHAAMNFLAPIDTRTLLYVARDEDWSDHGCGRSTSSAK
jgi:hypothetical protein